MSIFKRETKQLQALEGEIREFVRRDVAGPRRHTETADNAGIDNLSSLLQRVSGSWVQEIEEVISHLERLRGRLMDEAARVQREVVQYASLSQAAMTSTKVIADTLSRWKRTPDAPSPEGEGI
jgi:hypothetical protein